MTTIGISALLQAQNIYNNNIQKTADMAQIPSLEAAVSFQKMVNKNFNSYANMSAQEILAQVKQVNAQANGTQNVSSMAGAAIGTISKAVHKDDEVKKRNIIGEASLSEVIAATSEAKITLQTAVAVRNKLIESWNQIMNMPI